MRARSFLCLLAVVFALTGCVPEVSEPTPVPTVVASDAPIFASEEEALAAAEAAYAEYVRVSDLIGAEGGAGAERLIPFLSPDMYERESKIYEVLVESKRTIVGKTSYSGFILQRVSDAMTSVDIQAYVCVDVSNNRILDAAGIDVTPADRADRVSLQVTFEATSTSTVLTGSEVWSGSSVCY